MALSSGEIDALRACAIFRALDAPVVERLAAACRSRSMAPGQRIFSPFDKAEMFFIVLAGQVKVFQLSAEGKEQILHYYGPGKSFGEAAMWIGEKYPAFAEALAKTRLLVVERRVMLEALRRDAELAAGMIAGLAMKLHEFEQLIAELSLKDVVGRLAAMLLTEARDAGAETFDLAQTKRQLAARIGAAPETLSRALKKLEDAGYLAVRGPQITVRDAPALKRLAQIDRA